MALDILVKDKVIPTNTKVLQLIKQA